MMTMSSVYFTPPLICSARKMKGELPESYLPSAESAGPCSGFHPSVWPPGAQQSRASSPGSQESSCHPGNTKQAKVMHKT